MRTILITGASRGIGFTTAQKLLEQGNQVIAISRTPIEMKPQEQFHHFVFDLSDVHRINSLTKKLLTQFPKLDAIISNAGSPCFSYLEQISDQDIINAININLNSHIFLIRHLISNLKQKKSSDIIFMGSESAIQGGQQGTLYCAAKFGIRGFAEALRKEVSKQGVRVSCIHPGMVRTSFFDNQNFMPGAEDENAIEASDVADLIVMILNSNPNITFKDIILDPLKKVIIKK